MEKMEKVPLDKYRDGNCCPECGSMKINVNYQYPLYVTRDLRTEKERFFGYRNGEKILIRKPSNKMYAAAYKASQLDAQVWNYECRKCGWVSRPFVP